MKKRSDPAFPVALILFHFFSSCSEDETKVEPPEVVQIPLSDWSQKILLHESNIEYAELLEENSFAELNNTSGEFNFVIFLKEEIASGLSSKRYILNGNVSELNSFFNELIFLLDYEFQKERINATIDEYTGFNIPPGLVMGTEQVSRGVKDSAVSFFDTVWSIATSPIEKSKSIWNLAKQLDQEDFQNFKAGMNELVMNPKDGYQKLKELFVDFYLNKCRTMAVENGFELESAKFPESILIIEERVNQRLAGAGIFEVLLTFTGTKVIQTGIRSLRAFKNSRMIKLRLRSNPKKAPIKTTSVVDDIAKANAIAGGYKPNASAVAGVSRRLGVRRMADLFDRSIGRGLGGSRAANPYYNRIMHSLHRADKAGLDLGKTIDSQLLRVELHNPRPLRFHDPEILKSNLIDDYLRARDEFGIFTDKENISRLFWGKSPIVRKGKAIGQQLEVDHLIPRNHAPELDNVLSNLRYLPERQNIIRSDALDDMALSAVARMKKVNPNWTPSDAIKAVQAP